MQTPSEKLPAGVEPSVIEPGPNHSVFSNFKSRPSRPPNQPTEGCSPWNEEASARGSVAKDAPTTVVPQTLQSSIDAAVGRAYIYRFLARAFEYPDPEGWEWLASSPAKSALCIAAEGIESNLASKRHAEELASELNADSLDAFVRDYVAAFGHAARGSCPLNEIEYGDLKADPLFQPHRLADLAAFYRAFGLEVTEHATERHDHLCIELEFMSVLAAKEAFALEHQLEADQLSQCREAQKKFLREHLGRWTPACTRRLAQALDPGALKALAKLTQEFVMADCQRFGVTPGSEDLLLRPVDESAESVCASCGIRNLPPGALAATAAV